MPKISVIVPVYNMEKYVGECLESILGQTLADIEIIVINDGSTDSSLKIILEYQKRDNRIVIIDKKNQGVAVARNDGIKVSSGEYISFVDPDDMYADNDILFCCYKIAKKENVPIVGGKTLLLFQDGTIKEEKEIHVGNIKICAKGLTDYKDYQYDYGFTSFIYKRDLIVDNYIFFPHYSRFQDPPFFVKTMIAAKKFYLLDEPFYLYRQLPSISKLSAQKTLDFLHGIMDNLEISKANELSKLHYITAERLNTAGTYMALHNLENNDISKIIYYFIKATSMIDVEWLKNEGFLSMDFYLPELFNYTVSTSLKYEKLRKNAILRVAFGIFSRVSMWRGK